MKTRQFKQIPAVAPARRAELVIEGLRAVGSNVAALADELQKCDEAGAWRSGRLVYNAAREEAGKFLVLLDAWRAPAAKGATLSRHYARAGNHLAKLVYAQIADYSIASRGELVRAVNLHRRSLYLDGPNDHDWIFRNDLLMEREGALYVDLIDAEGSLEWMTPTSIKMPFAPSRSLLLVMNIMSTGLVSPEGLNALSTAWTGFDPGKDSHCSDWRARTAMALRAFPDRNLEAGRLSAAAVFVADRWPMPMVELEVEEAKVSPESLIAEREAAYEEWVAAEFGDGW